MDAIEIEEFGLLSISEIEDHRISGTLYLQYRVPILDMSESCRFDLVIHRAEVGVRDFRKKSIKALEALFRERLLFVISSMRSSGTLLGGVPKDRKIPRKERRKG